MSANKTYREASLLSETRGRANWKEAEIEGRWANGGLRCIKMCNPSTRASRPQPNTRGSESGWEARHQEIGLKSRFRISIR